MNTVLILHVTGSSCGVFLHVMSSTWLHMGLEGRPGYEAMCITAACITVKLMKGCFDSIWLPQFPLVCMHC